MVTSRTRKTKKLTPDGEPNTSSFWVTYSVAELARMQGVRPLTPEKLQKAEFWPDDLDPEDLVHPQPSD